MKSANIAVVVFKTTGEPEDLRKAITSCDKTHDPLGSGGYSVKDLGDDLFQFSELDTAPAEAYKVGIAGREIWARHDLLEIIQAALSREQIRLFTVRLKLFSTQPAADKAFEKRRRKLAAKI